jgi:hypothetical protein
MVAASVAGREQDPVELRAELAQALPGTANANVRANVT